MLEFQSSKKLFYTALILNILYMNLSTLQLPNSVFVPILHTTWWMFPLLHLAVLASGYWPGVRIYALTCALLVSGGAMGVLTSAQWEIPGYMLTALIAHVFSNRLGKEKERIYEQMRQSIGKVGQL